MSPHYYIDGYNVLHKSRTLRPLLERDFESARDGLVEKVAELCIHGGIEATLVFDGRSLHRAEVVDHFKGVKQLKVMYGPHHLSADAVIERLVYQSERRLDIVVVSNDNGLRSIVRGMGALTMDADYFLSTARESRESTQRTLRRTQQPKPSLIEDQLSDRSKSVLEELRKRLK